MNGEFLSLETAEKIVKLEKENKELKEILKMKLDKIENIVKNILEKEIETRSDDMYLYYIFCTKYGFISDNAFYKIFKDSKFRNSTGLSVFESVSRARRKIQANNPNLRPSKAIQEARDVKEAEYINYSINGYNPTFKAFIEHSN